MIPFLLNLSRIASAVALGETRAASVIRAGARFARTRTGDINIGEVISRVDAGLRWSARIHRAAARDNDEPFALLDFTPPGVHEDLKPQEVAILSTAARAAADEGLPLRASLSSELLSPGDVARVMRAMKKGANDGNLDLAPLAVSQNLALYTVASAGVLSLIGAAPGAVALAMTTSEWGALRALFPPDLVRALRLQALKYHASDADMLKTVGLTATPLALVSALSGDASAAVRAVSAAPPQAKEPLSLLLAHARQMKASQLGVAANSGPGTPWLLDMLESARAAIPPVAVLTGAALATAAAGASPASTESVRLRDLTDAGLPASGLWNPGRHIDGKPAPHRGADIPVATGVVVRAVGEGYVRWIRFDSRGGGLSLDVLYDAINGVPHLLITYRHLSKVLVQEGQSVPRGLAVAETGNSHSNVNGRRGSTGAHLHLEARVLKPGFFYNGPDTAKVPGADWQIVPVESILPNL